MNRGLGVVVEVNLRFLVYDCKVDVKEGSVGKKVTEEIEGEAME